MLGGVLCAQRPKPWLLSSLFFSHRLAGAPIKLFAGDSDDRRRRRHRLHSASCWPNSRRCFGPAAASHHWFAGAPIKPFTPEPDRRRHLHHSSSCQLNCGGVGGAASIWHAILPASGYRRGHVGKHAFQHEHKGEHKGDGSWNVAWDSRPARWLHRPDSAWLLFGVCPCLAAPLDFHDSGLETTTLNDEIDVSCSETITSDASINNSANYIVKGVPADGRCLFRAIAHMACLRNGDGTPDENHQRELADELRAQVAGELLSRREETEWFIEGDFDAYVKRIQQPYAWGGEPELLMASHDLKTPISVFMLDRNSDSLVNIASYGEEYKKDEENPIKLLFHGYGHYDILEAVSDKTRA